MRLRSCIDRVRRSLGSLAALGAWLCSSCAPGGFRDETKIAEVRIMASQADKPYAKPGDTVKVTVLAYDGRKSQPEPMEIYWLAFKNVPPYVCKDPPSDAYYACFQQLAGAGGRAPDAGAGPRDAGAGAGAGGGGLPAFPPGTTLPLVTGDTMQFTVPADAVTAHPIVPGTPVPYGLTIVFNIACAGHIQTLPLDPTSDNPVKVPFGCFDSNGNQLTPDDYVIGFTRVYAYDTLTNANPVIDHIDVEGQTVDMTQGFTTPHCTANLRNGCPKVHIGPVVPPSSWELNPEVTDVNGNPVHEEIWADFYSTFGQLSSSARLLYDARTGSIGGPDVTNNEFLPPNDPGDGFIWIVVHDNRGGTDWRQVPVHVN
jgi:hypothetical protein